MPALDNEILQQKLTAAGNGIHDLKLSLRDIEATADEHAYLQSTFRQTLEDLREAISALQNRFTYHGGSYDEKLLKGITRVDLDYIRYALDEIDPSDRQAFDALEPLQKILDDLWEYRLSALPETERVSIRKFTALADAAKQFHHVMETYIQKDLHGQIGLAEFYGSDTRANPADSVDYMRNAGNFIANDLAQGHPIDVHAAALQELREHDTDSFQEQMRLAMGESFAAKEAFRKLQQALDAVLAGRSR